ncbi:chain length determinant protein tyrosine kinase EpsG [Polaromonas sp. CG_9.11]|uniref:chain length determinant protein tyrosine kinase EpsG n=1 Tax=Polaromonas sp. CG_9.11 TaxID=2787730 RepID=UPI0018CAA601|nr:chain length determinant protein tyrosine kinase EpsG [Polaromonas sp. CG_9.11]MBG6076052.1 chain length determinant protein tyrosine kinase EpsG [Polaromonas sp. CG_9.11]
MNTQNSQIVRSIPLVKASTNPLVESGHARPMGSILIDSGRLSGGNAEKILTFQRENGVRFGEAGRTLGLLTEDDVRFALSVQFHYSYIPSGSSLSHELIAAYQPDSVAVEELRMLRSQLMLRWFNNGSDHKGLAVVSAGSGDGRSYIAANLAIVFSQLGERTLLIDADMRIPRQHILFSLGKRAGLSDILVGRAGSDAIVRIDALSNLSVLSAGAIPPNPQELLGRQSFSKLLLSLAEDFDVMIIDTPPASACADAHTVAVRTGAALVVARQNRSSVVQLGQFTHSLREFGVTLVGSVLNDT